MRTSSQCPRCKWHLNTVYRQGQVFHFAQFVFRSLPAIQAGAFEDILMMFETSTEQDCAQNWFDIGLRTRRRGRSFTLITLLLVIVVFVVLCRPGTLYILQSTWTWWSYHIHFLFFALFVVVVWRRCNCYSEVFDVVLCVVFCAVVCQASLSTPHTYVHTFQEMLRLRCKL